jgi:hypothetical protein
MPCEIGYQKALRAAKMDAGHPDLAAPTFIMVKKRLLSGDSDAPTPDHVQAGATSGQLREIAAEIRDATADRADQLLQIADDMDRQKLK